MKEKLKYIGALTNKSYIFKNRPWETKKTKALDIFDSLGTNIQIETYGAQIKRILPWKNDEINREYISNRIRFFFDGLNRWRIITPIFKNKNDFLYSSWSVIFPNIILRLIKNVEKKKFLGMFLTNFVDLNIIFLTKILSNIKGFFVLKNKNLNLSDYYGFYINPNFLKVLKKKKILIFMGSILRLESPIINIRIRLNLLNNKTMFLSFGSKYWNNLNTISLGINTKKVLKVLNGKHKLCTSILKKLKESTEENLGFIVGSVSLNRSDNSQLIKVIDLFIWKLKNGRKEKEKLKKKKELKTQIFQIIPTSLNKILYNELSIFNSKFLEKDLNIRYFLGLNRKLKLNKDQLNIFQGHHTINSNLKNLDIILPTLNFVEKRNSYLNLEGSVQESNTAVINTANVKSDWIIFNTFIWYLSESVFWHYDLEKSINKKFVELKRLKEKNWNFRFSKKGMFRKYSSNILWKELSKYSFYNYNYKNNLKYNLDKVIKVYNSVFYSLVGSNYSLDSVSKNSKWMLISEKSLKKEFNNFIIV